MDGFEFENCGNAVLKCEGKILGGVEKATCTRKNSFTEIKEFFNDKPVERIVSNEWELTFVMKITDKTPFLERDSFKSLELDLAKKKIIYTDCKVLEFSSVTQSSGSILATVKISAYERKIICMIKIQTNFTGLRSLRTAVKIPKCSANSLKGKAVVTVADLTKKRRRKADETGADEIR